MANRKQALHPRFGYRTALLAAMCFFLPQNESPVRQWEVYNPIIVGGLEQVMKQVDPNAPEPPPNSGIRFVSESR